MVTSLWPAILFRAKPLQTKAARCTDVTAFSSSTPVLKRCILPLLKANSKILREKKNSFE